MHIKTCAIKGLSVVLSATLAAAQTLPNANSQSVSQTPQITYNGSGPLGAYRSRHVSSANFRNSARLYDLVRAGKLYLSLQDAISLTLENNLDLQLQRYNPLIAQTEVKRAKGGGLLRGLVYTIRELPQGVGGPGSPLLTTVGGNAPVTTVTANSSDLAVINQANTDLSVISTIPSSTGSPVPAFDPLISANANYGHTSTPATNIFAAGTSNVRQDSANGSASYTQAFSPGTQIATTYNTARITTNSLRNDYNPYTTGSLGFNLSQPLIRGFGIDLNRRFIRIAENEEKISNLIFNQQLIVTVASVIRLYWDLVSLNENVRVRQQALNAAQKLYQDNRAQVEVGTLAPLQLTQAQAEVARSRQDLITAQSLVDQQEVLFKNVITRSGGGDPALTPIHVVPLDHIEVPKQESFADPDSLVNEAFRARPDLAQAQVQIQNANLNLKGSKNALKPQLNLVGALANNALAGTVNPLPPPSSAGIPGNRNFDPALLGDFGSLWSQILRRNYPDYSVGLQLNIPLRNRVAQADEVRDELQLRQSETRLRVTQNQVRVEVQNALVAVERARATFDAAEETRVLQEQALANERQRLAVGQSTLFNIIQFERDVAQTQSTAVVAAGEYAKARAALDRALGRTLTANNISLSEAISGSVSRPATPIPAQAVTATGKQ